MKILLDNFSRTPVYEQIKEQIILGVSTGALEPNEKLPSLRILASELNLNINTVKRAFSELEMQGVIYTVQGKGAFVNPNTDVGRAMYLKGVTESFTKAVEDAQKVGVKENDLIKIIKEIYNKE